ncbi:MAG: hypothetical protein SynsKO_37010 [Synoicihabitans sp.]
MGSVVPAFIMQWFYASDGERRGPVSPEQLANLIAQGLVNDETLVWREGFANWQAWGEVAAENPLPTPPPDTPPVPPTFTPEESSDAANEAEHWSMEEFTQKLRGNGFATSIGGCLSRAWDNYRSFFGLALGAVCVAILVSMVAGFIPLAGFFATFLVSPHINAGMAWIFLKKARGEDVEFGDVFAGFSRNYGKLVLLALIQFLVVLIGLMVFIIPMVLIGVPLAELESGAAPDLSGTQGLALGLLMAFLVAVMIYFSARFFLAHIIAIDRPESAIDAFRLSWRITSGRFLTVFGLMIVLVVLGIAGALALLIGLIFVAPMYGAIVAQLYHDACESAAARPPE